MNATRKQRGWSIYTPGNDITTYYKARPFSWAKHVILPTNVAACFNDDLFGKRTRGVICSDGKILGVLRDY